MAYINPGRVPPAFSLFLMITDFICGGFWPAKCRGRRPTPLSSGNEGNLIVTSSPHGNHSTYEFFGNRKETCLVRVYKADLSLVPFLRCFPLKQILVS
jgi:hypothetical protein